MGDNCQTETQRLADQLERSFHGGAWHGPSVAEALAGVDATTASWRSGDVHSIAEIAGHIGFWIDGARRRIAGESLDDLPPEGDWSIGGAASDAAWRITREEIETAHRNLQTAVRALDDAGLEAAVSGADPTIRGQLLGLLQHNAYHAGQIVMLAKMARQRHHADRNDVAGSDR